MRPGELYQYKARCLSVYDGDTMTLSISLGLDIYHTAVFRLHGLNAPEIRLGGLTDQKEKERGLMVRDLVRGLVEGREVLVKTIKDTREKYGRYLAVVYFQDPALGVWVNLNQLLLEQGHAVAM